MLSLVDYEISKNKKPINWLILVKRRATKFRPKAVGGGIFSSFSNFDKCRPEIDGDVISRVVVDHIGVDLRAKFGDSGLNSGRIIRLFSRPQPFQKLMMSYPADV